MTGIDRLGPELVLVCCAGSVRLTDLCWPRRSLLGGLGLLAMAGSLAWTGSLVARDMRGTAFDGMLVVDDFSLFFAFLFAGVATLVILASIEYAERFSRYQGEYYALILASTAGMMLMAATTDLIAIFVALELTSISLYILGPFMKTAPSSVA